MFQQNEFLKIKPFWIFFFWLLYSIFDLKGVHISFEGFFIFLSSSISMSKDGKKYYFEVKNHQQSDFHQKDVAALVKLQ